MDLHPRAVCRRDDPAASPRSSMTRTVWSPSMVSVASMACSFRVVRIPGPHQQPLRRLAGFHAPRALPTAGEEVCAELTAERRSPSTSPIQRASRGGSVSADHRSSISVSKRSSMRTMPLPSADRRLPRMRSRHLRCWSFDAPSFAFPSGHLGVEGVQPLLPQSPDSPPAIHRPLPAARAVARRSASALPCGPRQAPPPAGLAGVGTPPAARLAAAPPAPPRLPDRPPGSSAASAGSRPPMHAVQPPWACTYPMRYVTVKVHTVVPAWRATIGLPDGGMPCAR